MSSREAAPSGQRAADGRTLRSQRTRASIVDANMALMMEGTLRPTAAQVAERAGVSLRTLWSHFPDLESLFAATGEKTLEVQYSHHFVIPADQPLEDRVRAFCRQRAEMLESIAGASRAAQLRLPFSAQLRRNRRRHNERLRTDIGQTFAPEIALATGDADEIVSALLVACTWPAWMGSRDDLGLSVDEATRVMERTVTAIFKTAGDPPRPSA
ncbi:TetR/AcrR family transcriptional regulator [Actinomadura sp. WMMB 499]|uniref:TetR/AcrR family transcriptional regulator n=1 Tax=Actinomadura sp. WMMB 499 TaxID=1219491 RepID=UPI001247E6A7|nr:TetR/AcrR family transcriptional regulator [Actinomadura sp. WMMB 499]QFG21620.1 TetR/AcrR family transcriptional regulator [Actinomadura sp. WMMB 499]